jgi:hypothetical protein
MEIHLILTGKVAIFLRLKRGVFFFFVILFCIKVVGFYKKYPLNILRKNKKAKNLIF